MFCRSTRWRRRARQGIRGSSGRGAGDEAEFGENLFHTWHSAGDFGVKRAEGFDVDELWRMVDATAGTKGGILKSWNGTKRWNGGHTCSDGALEVRGQVWQWDVEEELMIVWLSGEEKAKRMDKRYRFVNDKRVSRTTASRRVVRACKALLA